MLARANRVVHADDFKRIVRRGSRIGTPHALLYVSASQPGVSAPRVNVSAPQQGSTRFGFIVSKAVGNAVVRNLMARRLRSIGHDYLVDRASSTAGQVPQDIVIRALPGSPEVPWATLRVEILGALDASVHTGKASER